MRLAKMACNRNADRRVFIEIPVLHNVKLHLLWLLPPLMTAALYPAIADAHDAPSGWSYPYACCSNQDCRPVATKAISEKAAGYIINVTGEVVPYADRRIRTSPDGEFHWCSVAGENKTRTLCLFVPPRAY